jgi:two-component system, cell cycle response regulator DivK
MDREILIIDDNDHERDIFASFLRFVGGTVREARNGQEGLDVARAHRPSLILLDLTMPVLDGWGAIVRLRTDPRTEAIPVIALTAHHLEWERLEQAGFCAYLEKPIVPFRVLEEVERCLGSVDSASEVNLVRSGSYEVALAEIAGGSLLERGD